MSEASPTISNHSCRATRADGQPCRAPALSDGRCFAHAPALHAKRDAARRRGGRGKATAARLDRRLPASLKPTLALLLASLDEVHRGDLSPQAAGAMAALSTAIVRLYTTATLEERISALEAAQDDGRQRA